MMKGEEMKKNEKVGMKMKKKNLQKSCMSRFLHGSE